MSGGALPLLALRNNKTATGESWSGSLQQQSSGHPHLQIFNVNPNDQGSNPSLTHQLPVLTLRFKTDLRITGATHPEAPWTRIGARLRLVLPLRARLRDRPYRTHFTQITSFRGRST